MAKNLSNRKFISNKLMSKKEYDKSPVYEMYKNIMQKVSKLPPNSYMYEHRLAEYLRNALVADMLDSATVLSCMDLAETFSDEYEEEKKTKNYRWLKLVKQATLTRGGKGKRRLIHMQLYPGFFYEILIGIKNVEGRAFDPTSEKNYQGISMGDKIKFTICRERQGWKEECKEFGLAENTVIIAEVCYVHFSSTVHGIFNMILTGDLQPRHFPHKGRVAELLSIPHVAEYYRIHGYPEKIKKFGFLGIELDNLRITSK